MKLAMAANIPEREPLVRALVPGRINLIGEHTDYNGGKVLPFAMEALIEFQLWAEGPLVPARQASFTIASASLPGILEVHGAALTELYGAAEDCDSSSDLRSMLPEPVRLSWARYAVGALVACWRQHGPDKLLPQQTHMTLKSNIPYGAGVSSSAALSTGLIATLLASAKEPISKLKVARAAQRVEHQFAGIRCGLMDQIAVLCAEAEALLLIDFRDLSTSDRVTTEKVRLHPNFGTYRAVLANTMVRHELGASPYNERRAACEDGVERLGKVWGRAYPTAGHFANDPAFLAAFAADGQQHTLVASLTKLAFPAEANIAARVAHAIMEVARVDQAVAALRSGDRESLSQAMNASHQSLAHDYEVSCPELDLLREQALQVGAALGSTAGLAEPGILGARMTGGGFGGCTIQLVHQSILQPFCTAMANPTSSYVQRFAKIPELIISNLGPGLRLTRGGNKYEDIYE